MHGTGRLARTKISAASIDLAENSLEAGVKKTISKATIGKKNSRRRAKESHGGRKTKPWTRKSKPKKLAEKEWDVESIVRHEVHQDVMFFRLKFVGSAKETFETIIAVSNATVENLVVPYLKKNKLNLNLYTGKICPNTLEGRPDPEAYVKFPDTEFIDALIDRMKLDSEIAEDVEVTLNHTIEQVAGSLDPTEDEVSNDTLGIENLEEKAVLKSAPRGRKNRPSRSQIKENKMNKMREGELILERVHSHQVSKKDDGEVEFYIKWKGFPFKGFATHRTLDTISNADMLNHFMTYIYCKGIKMNLYTGISGPEPTDSQPEPFTEVLPGRHEVIDTMLEQFEAWDQEWKNDLKTAREDSTFRSRTKEFMLAYKRRKFEEYTDNIIRTEDNGPELPEPQSKNTKKVQSKSKRTVNNEHGDLNIAENDGMDFFEPDLFSDPQNICMETQESVPDNIQPSHYLRAGMEADEACLGAASDPDTCSISASSTKSMDNVADQEVGVSIPPEPTLGDAVLGKDEQPVLTPEPIMAEKVDKPKVVQRPKKRQATSKGTHREIKMAKRAVTIAAPRLPGMQKESVLKSADNVKTTKESFDPSSPEPVVHQIEMTETMQPCEMNIIADDATVMEELSMKQEPCAELKTKFHLDVGEKNASIDSPLPKTSKFEKERSIEKIAMEIKIDNIKVSAADNVVEKPMEQKLTNLVEKLCSGFKSDDHEKVTKKACIERIEETDTVQPKSAELALKSETTSNQIQPNSQSQRIIEVIPEESTAVEELFIGHQIKVEFKTADQHIERSDMEIVTSQSLPQPIASPQKFEKEMTTNKNENVAAADIVVEKPIEKTKTIEKREKTIEELEAVLKSWVPQVKRVHILPPPPPPPGPKPKKPEAIHSKVTITKETIPPPPPKRSVESSVHPLTGIHTAMTQNMMVPPPPPPQKKTIQLFPTPPPPPPKPSADKNGMNIKIVPIVERAETKPADRKRPLQESGINGGNAAMTSPPPKRSSFEENAKCMEISNTPVNAQAKINGMQAKANEADQIVKKAKAPAVVPEDIEAGDYTMVVAHVEEQVTQRRSIFAFDIKKAHPRAPIKRVHISEMKDQHTSPKSVARKVNSNFQSKFIENVLFYYVFYHDVRVNFFTGKTNDDPFTKYVKVEIEDMSDKRRHFLSKLAEKYQRLCISMKSAFNNRGDKSMSQLAFNKLWREDFEAKRKAEILRIKNTLEDPDIQELLDQLAKETKMTKESFLEAIKVEEERAKVTSKSEIERCVKQIELVLRYFHPAAVIRLKDIVAKAPHSSDNHYLIEENLEKMDEFVNWIRHSREQINVDPTQFEKLSKLVLDRLFLELDIINRGMEKFESSTVHSRYVKYHNYFLLKNDKLDPHPVWYQLGLP